jgi:hypothetical protein
LIITGSRQVHHLHSAACKTEGHRPQRALTGPVCNLIKGSPSVEVSGSHRGKRKPARKRTRHIA